LRFLPVLLLVATLAGCTTGQLNTIDDISESLQSLTGTPVTARVRLERIITAHDRTDASSWPLLPTEDGESQLRWVLRDIEKLEEIEYSSLTPRMAVVLVLGDIGTRSQASLVRARSTLASARSGKGLSPDAGLTPKAVDDARLGEIFKWIKQADANLPKEGAEDTPELTGKRREALTALATMRFWPPLFYARPGGGGQDAFRAGKKWSRSLLDFVGSVRFQSDREDPAFGPALEAKAGGLAAEVIRFTVANALLRDPDDQVRFDAVSAALEVGTKDMVPVLAAAAIDDSADLVRFRLAQALGEIGASDPAEAVPSLITLLDDLDQSVRRAARASLTTLAGADQGEDQAAWLTWWAANGPSEKRP